MTRNELCFLGTELWPRWVDCHRMPSTQDIYLNRKQGDRFVIQLIAGEFNAYDLKTLRPLALNLSQYTIGIPVFVSESFDAAMMWCNLEITRDG